MKSDSLSIEQAKDLCDKNQYIIGNVIVLDLKLCVVKHVSIAPYDKINMLLFLELYKEMKDFSKAISFYKGTEYDVAVILSQADDAGNEQYRIVNLRRYFEAAQIKQDITVKPANNSFHVSV